MENEKFRNEEELEKGEETGLLVKDFSQLNRQSSTKCDIFTNITDEKKIFNLENKVDYLLNDCEGEMIRVKEVLVKKYEKPLKEPVIDEETGEVLKDKEYSMCTILIDDNNKSYATGSKIFTIEMMKYLEMFGITEKGFEIKIFKEKYGENGGKALHFELV